LLAYSFPGLFIHLEEAPMIDVEVCISFPKIEDDHTLKFEQGTSLILFNEARIIAITWPLRLPHYHPQGTAYTAFPAIILGRN
jgi:hypothetical protein